MVMPLEIFGFLKFSFTDMLDVLLVGLLIYFIFRWIRDSAAMNIFTAVISIYVLRVIADALKMKLISALLGTFIDGSKLGYKTRRFIGKFLGNEDKAMDNAAVKEITEACRSMSEQKTGALIVIPHTVSLSDIIETGDRIDANINRRLIMNLFFKNSPLHDGAVIIDNHHIVAARCTLPITERTDIPARFGMRHKAAIGITEETDADVIVVSEETGEISFVHGGTLTEIQNMNELKLKLGASLSSTQEKQEKESHDRRKN